MQPHLIRVPQRKRHGLRRAIDQEAQLRRSRVRRICTEAAIVDEVDALSDAYRATASQAVADLIVPHIGAVTIDDIVEVPLPLLLGGPRRVVLLT